MHVERGHEKRRPNNGFHLLRMFGAHQFVSEHRHFERRRGAEIVQKHRTAIAFHVRAKAIHDHRHGGTGGFEGHLFDARLAVDAETELTHAGLDAIFLADARYGAGIERHADRGDGIDDALGCGANLFE